MRSSCRPARDSASAIVDACGPKSPDSHRAVWGLNSRPPVPPAGFLRFPGCPPVLPLPPPSSGFPSSGVLRFVPFGRCPVPVPPSVSLRVPFPLGNLHVSAAAGRFRRRRSQAAGTKVTSSAVDNHLAWIARSARTPDGPRLGTTGCRHRIAGYERPPSTGHRRARTAQIEASLCQEVFRVFFELRFGGTVRVRWVAGRSVDSGPGVAWPKSRRPGCKPAALATESFPGCPPGPLSLAAAAARRVSAWSGRRWRR
jgi:hypothetical protein